MSQSNEFVYFPLVIPKVVTRHCFNGVYLHQKECQRQTVMGAIGIVSSSNGEIGATDPVTLTKAVYSLDSDNNMREGTLEDRLLSMEGKIASLSQPGSSGVNISSVRMSSTQPGLIELIIDKE